MQEFNKSISGTLESGDIMIMLEPSEEGIIIDLKSSVEKQFGRQIRETILTTLKEEGIENCRVKAIDKGALDFTIKARVRTAVYRAFGESSKVNWGGLS